MNAATAVEFASDVADPSVQDRDLRGQQLELLCKQSTRVPMAIAFAMAFVAYLVWESARPDAIAAWLSVLSLLLLARRKYAARWLRAPGEDPEAGLRRMVAFAFAIGAAAGSAALLFFFPLPNSERAILTMILVCWTAGGVSTAAAYAPAFYFYVGPALAPLTLCWLLAGGTENSVVGFLIVLFAMFQVYFVRDNERVLRRSFELRFEKEQLIREKERLIAQLVAARDEAQSAIGQLVVARDEAQSANGAISKLLAFACHDLRQPCLALGLCSSAFNLLATTPQMQGIARQLSQAVGVLAYLLDCILDYSQLHAGAVRPALKWVRLSEVIGDLEQEFRMLAAKSDLRFEVRSLDVVIWTDQVLLARILRNLIQNAIKYTRQGKVDLIVQAEAGSYCISVCDTGRGIPPGERQRIFDAFYQIPTGGGGRSEGLGLGLSIVNDYVRLLGYAVEVDSEVGKGSKFSLTIPATGDGINLDVAEKRAADLVPDLSNIVALVVDHDGSGANDVPGILKTWGCRIISARSPVEALSILQQDTAGWHLVVIDLDRYHREDGSEPIDRLRAMLEQIPAVVVPSNTSPQKLKESIETGLTLVNKAAT